MCVCAAGRGGGGGVWCVVVDDKRVCRGMSRMHLIVKAMSCKNTPRLSHGMKTTRTSNCAVTDAG